MFKGCNGFRLFWFAFCHYWGPGSYFLILLFADCNNFIKGSILIKFLLDNSDKILYIQIVLCQWQ